MTLIAAPNLRPKPAAPAYSLKPENARPLYLLLERFNITIDRGNRHALSNWVFENGDVTVACLWWAAMEVDAEGTFTTINLLEEPPGATRKQEARKRALDLYGALHRAYLRESPVHVIVVDRPDYSLEALADPVAARTRRLDDSPWWVTSIDANGEVTLRRDGRMQLRKWLPPAAKVPVRPPDAHEALATDLAEIEQRADLTTTAKAQLREARLGQGAFREALIQRWGGTCPLTGCNILPVLRASHIVPWRDATDKERLDPNNGLLLSASADALFDRGLITFEPSGALRPAKNLEETQVRKIITTWRLPLMTPEEQAYLKRHRENYFEVSSQ
jgi:hypothetical protein